jgi:glutamate-1-semialdehyde 2,1-aminomutase
LGIPSSPGVPHALAELTITLDYNNIQQVQELFVKRGEQIAAVIVEPVAGNMNCVLPEVGFLETLRSVCDQYGSVLIFDEVMTGFRVGLGGAQERFKVRPDLTTLGKVIGGGLPVGAFGGRRDIMEHLAPLGNVYQAGTLSGNPIAMTAGLATLDLITVPDFFANLERNTKRLVQGLTTKAQTRGIPFTTNHCGGMFGFFFTSVSNVTNYLQVTNCDIGQFSKFFHTMLKRGFYFAPSAYEAGFVSYSHTEIDIDATIEAAEEVFNYL